MPMWAEFVDVIYGTLVCVSTALGGSMGWAIALVSLLVRIALLPLMLRMAYQGLQTQAALERLEPQLQRLRKRCGKDQRRLLEETAQLYQQNGVRVADPRSVLGALAQLPIFMGLFGAIRRGLVDGGRFLWVRDIGVPNFPLAALCAAVTAVSALLAPHVSASHRVPLVLLPAVLTLVFLSRMAAGLSIYALAQGIVGVGQALLVRRRARRLASA